MLGKQVAKTIEEHRMFSRGDTLIVGVSGGADSVALLNLLSSLPGYQQRLVVAHVNHLLRGDESDEDEAFVRGLARTLSLSFESKKVDVGRYAADLGISLEDAGRQIRYGFFLELKERYAARAVAVAHTADDQAETFLMRLLRGACGTGLRAMLPVTSQGVVRPLLTVTRDEIERYLIEKGVEWRVDSSNADTSFLRNRIRAELLPLLRQYNPAIRDSLTATAQVLAADEDVLDSLTVERFRLLAAKENGLVTFPVKELAGQPESMRLRLIRMAICQVKGNLHNLSTTHIHSVQALIFTAKPNSLVTLPAGYTVRRSYDKLVFARNTAPVGPYELTIDSAGTYPLPSGGSLVVSKVGSEVLLSELPARLTLVDGQLAPFPWTVRLFRAGDRIRLAGMDGRKKVKKVFMEEQVPLDVRGRVPLLFCGDALLWICGIRRSVAAFPGGSSGAYSVELKL